MKGSTCKEYTTLSQNMKSMLDIDKGRICRCFMQGNEDDTYSFHGSQSFQSFGLP
jgi:hypothetical protein